jgi:hypothetical protein
MPTDKPSRSILIFSEIQEVIRNVFDKVYNISGKQSLPDNNFKELAQHKAVVIIIC